MGGQKNTQFVWTPTKRRGPIAAEFSTPGPAAINLPPTFGSKVTVTKSRSPAFTISGRHESRSSTASPGPGQYNINGLTYKGKDEPHAPSMHIRPKDPKPFVTPAPGDYCPEKSKKVLDPSPKFSFGVKTENGPASDVPGPGSYNEAFVDKYKTAKSPAFSMGQRTNIPSDHTQKPGPGAHSPEKCMQDSTPKWTMAPRTELPTDKSPKPSPNTYSPEKCMQESTPKWTMAPRTELPTDKSPKPSPNTYCPEKYVAEFTPQWTMAPRTELPSDKSPKPSPNAYSPEKYNAEEGPKWTMALRTEIPCDKSPKPAPNAYSPDEAAMAHHNPEFSFGIKHSPYLGKLRDQ